MRWITRVVALIILAGPGATAAHDPSAWGGMFRSRDDGATWLPADAGLFIGGAMALAISPVDPNHLLYATDTRLLRSRNGGRDWNPEAADKLIGPTLSAAFDQLGRGAVASSSAGVFRTEDGVKWERSAAPAGAAPARAIVAGKEPGRYYLAGPRGVFTSRDGGRSFARAADGLPDAVASAISVIAGTPEGVLVIIEGTLWISADAGASWRQSRRGLPEGRIDAAASNARPARTLWAFGADQLFKSHDAGESWHAVGRPPAQRGTSARGLAVSDSGQVIVLTTHRGLLRSADGGESWAVVEGVLPTHLESGPLLRDPHDHTTLYAGFALTPYAEIFRRAEQGNSLLSRIDPVSLAGGLAFLLLVVIGGIWLARRLARSPYPQRRNERPPA
jgi:photosystem II stability/assembly factor-like uncharacterized protein